MIFHNDWNDRFESGKILVQILFQIPQVGCRTHKMLKAAFHCGNTAANINMPAVLSVLETAGNSWGAAKVCGIFSWDRRWKFRPSERTYSWKLSHNNPWSLQSNGTFIRQKNPQRFGTNQLEALHYENVPAHSWLVGRHFLTSI